MKRGTILLTLGALIVLFVAYATWLMGEFNFPMLLLGLAGLVVGGVGASQRWERAKP